MKKKACFILLSVFLFSKIILSQTIKDKEENHIPLEDFFRKPIKSDFSLSPNGEYLAWLAPYKDRMNIFVQKIGDSKIKRITSVIERDINRFFWKGDENLIYLKDKEGDENFHLFTVDKMGRNQKDLTPFNETRVLIIDTLEEDPNHMI